ncbi:MAG: hypothetical protein ACYDER_29285 [Ktedonobacteraceae bacterium]
MSKLPINPTKSEILEQNWLEFLSALKAEREAEYQPYGIMAMKLGYETAFWSWYIEKKEASK